MRTTKAKHIVIATGSDVMPLPGVGIDEKRILSSTGALALGKVPKTLAVIGAGYIGLEMGSVWARLGAQVTVVEYLDRILPGMDGEIAKQVQRILKKQGLDFRLGRKVTGAKPVRGGVTLSVEPAPGGVGDGDAETLKAEAVLVAIGRRPFTDDLGLDTAGIGTDARGFIPVDGRFRTGAAGVYAIGDVIPGPMLAHKAEEEGVALAEMLAGQAGHVNYETVPGIVYTWPEVASVGRTEEQLKEAGTAYKAGRFPFGANSRAICTGETDGMVKILADAGDRAHPRRPYRRAGGRQHDPRGRQRHGIRRLRRRPRPLLPRPPDLQRSRPRSRAGRERGGTAAVGGVRDGAVSFETGVSSFETAISRRRGACPERSRGAPPQWPPQDEEVC